MNISIIIPTYKPGKYLKDCLDSISKQTLYYKDFEVIIVLNGIVEQYLDYITGIIKDYKFDVNVIPTTTAGVSNARNIGLKVAKGKYICFIDDDDKISPTYLEDLYNKASKDVIVASNVKAFCTDTTNLEEDYISKAFIEKKKQNAPLSVLEGRKFMSSSCCKIICKEIIQDIRFDTNLKIGEDSVFMAKISKNIKSIVLSDNNAIYYRRLRQGSASRSTIPFKKRLNIVYALICAYIKLLTPKYNFGFILTRIAATIIKLKRID